MEASVDFLNRMNESKVPVDTGSYNHILAVTAKSGDPLTAKMYFEEMQEKRISPDAYTFSSTSTEIFLISWYLARSCFFLMSIGEQKPYPVYVDECGNRHHNQHQP